MIDPALLETVSVPLALQDAMPVVLSTAGMVVIARSASSKLGRPVLARIALSSAVLIGAGGMAKVIWKVALAGFERDLAGLDNLLFPLLAVGFYGLRRVVLAAREAEPDLGAHQRRLIAGRATIAVLVMALVIVDLDLGLGVAMVIAILGSLGLSRHLILVARAAGDARALWFLVVNLAATLALGGLARAETQSLGLQWIEQSVNTVSQLLFLLAALRLASSEVPWVPIADDAAAELQRA